MSDSGSPPRRAHRLLTALHRRLSEVTGGTRSVVLRKTAAGAYLAISGDGPPLERPRVCLEGSEAATVDRCFEADGTAIAAAEELPTLGHQLATPFIVILPVTILDTPIIAAVGVEAVPPQVTTPTHDMAAAFAAALELARAEQELHFHRRLRELLFRFSRDVSSTLHVTSALQKLTLDMTHVLGARDAEIWLHHRRENELELAAASNLTTQTGRRVSIRVTTEPAAKALRLERPVVDEGLLLVPLRGWRRALGAVVVSGAERSDFDERQLLDLTRELGRQLSAAIETVQLLREILRQRRLLEDTFNSIHDLIVVTDTDFRIVQTNEAFALRVGASRSDLIGRGLSEFVAESTATWFETASLERSSPAGGVQPVEDSGLGGTFLLTATRLVSQEGQTVGRVLVARDITRQTRLEAERATLRERLAQSEKLASLGQFVAGVAHEMNNPLQGVLGHLELLIDTSETARPLRRQLRQIYVDADRAAKIVRNLLMFAGSRRISRRRLQIERVLTRALASRGASLKRAGIEVIRHQGEDLPRVKGDPLLLQQALLNIIINAEHAVSDETLRTKRIELSTGTDAAHERVTISIRDSGRGIAPDVLPRIFDPFFTTKEVGQGAGLGLAITYGIVQEHGGTISATNTPEGGAMFSVELPAADLVIE